MKNPIIDREKSITPPKPLSYNEIVEFLDKNWGTNLEDTSLSKLKQLDAFLDHPSKKLPSILISGTNGKSLTTGFATQLLKEENLKVGAFTSPHVLTYNERFAVNGETISNKTFTEVGNDILQALAALDLSINSYEMLTMIALVFFKTQNVDVAILETVDNNLPQATTLCNPCIIGITRIAEETSLTINKASEEIIRKKLAFVKKGAHVVSADQSKLNLQIMQNIVDEVGGTWEMPIRKLVNLPYPFPQLHGRCAGLAERIAKIFVNEFMTVDEATAAQSLLTKTKGQRGRPTLEAKEAMRKSPKKTLDQFWKSTVNNLPCKFHLLEKEKPSILVDTAKNLDALKNVLLGIRLLHYQRPLKGLCLILGTNDGSLESQDLLKLLRYFFKKTSGSIILCPTKPMPETTVTLGNNASWDITRIANDLKAMKLKVRTAENLKEALEHASQSVDERNGLVVITGSQEIVSEYWHNKGTKKL